MGVFCSTVDKDGDEPSERKAKGPVQNHQLVAQFPHRLHKMPANNKILTRSRTHELEHLQQFENLVVEGGFEDEKAYNAARDELRKQERENAFDARMTANAKDYEKQAADLLQKIREYDWRTSYNIINDDKGHAKHPRPEGEHFLGNVDLINGTELMKVARKMPKGAHLHVHFNSCLPAKYLIQQARNIKAMYIKSSISLAAPGNFAVSRIAFNVMTPKAAVTYKNPDGTEYYRDLGNIFEAHYVPDTWMSYKLFQERFYLEEGKVALWGTEGAERWLERKMLISEEEAHSTHQTGRGIWEKFNYRTQMMKGLFAYESAFRHYTRACIQDFVDDNIQYAEIRPNFMQSNSLKSDDGEKLFMNQDILGIIGHELKKTMGDLAAKNLYFGGMKVIYCTPRSFAPKEVEAALNECILLKNQYPDLLCGFDLVGHEEMGNELHHFIPQFLNFKKNCKANMIPYASDRPDRMISAPLDIPFLFHCGETLDVGSKIDGNLYDAILLNSKRIGHGYALARHPFLMEYFKKKNIAIESCPISNEILGLTPSMAGHNLPILLANNVPCTINSDNATFYKSSLSHDFYQVMIGSQSMNLYGWKQLAVWSLEHSCMDSDEKRKVMKIWEKKWEEFCKWIVETYGPGGVKEHIFESANSHL